jgi:hypothetical protein
MSSGTLCFVAVVRSNVSENILPPSSGFLKVTGLRSYVTMESLLISLSIERYYVWSKKFVSWDILGRFNSMGVFILFIYEWSQFSFFSSITIS